MSHYKIYPNPVKDYLVVKPAKAVDEYIDLSIFSYEGLLFGEYKFNHPDNHYEYIVDVKNLPRGKYYVMIHSNQEYIIEKMEKS
jgi:hypothetical protein